MIRQREAVPKVRAFGVRRLLWWASIVAAAALLVADGVGAPVLWLVGARLWWPALAGSVAAAVVWWLGLQLIARAVARGYWGGRPTETATALADQAARQTQAQKVLGWARLPPLLLSSLCCW